MRLINKYYEELYFVHQKERALLPRNQETVSELLNKNGAVGIVGLSDEPGYPIYFISGFTLTALDYEYREMLRACDGQFLNLIYEKDRKAFTENIKEGEPFRQEVRLVNGHGKNVWVNLYQKKSVSMDGRPIVIASIRVVEDARKRESELLDALTKGYDRIIYVDLNQGRYRVIKSERDYLDEQVCGTLSELEEMLQQYAQEYINPDDRTFLETLNKLDFFSASGETGGNYQATYRAKIHNVYQWVQFQVFYGGAMHLDTGHMILTFRIVDEEKKKELDANRILSDSLARAEEAGRIKDKFLSRMSHDLRTPLNGIVGMLEIVRRSRSNPDKIADCVDKISRSCDHLMSLVNHVLDMGTLKDGKSQLQEEEFCLEQLLTDSLSPLAKRAAACGFTYTSDVGPFAHPCVIGSPSHVRQIFEHILDNAIKYNRPNGSIVLTAHEVSFNHNLALYEFMVEDTGIGMDSDFIKTMFDPFEQEKNDARTEYMGIGLGLSIAKTLVDQMNGNITVESTPAVGTKFFITLPFRVSDDSEEHSVSTPEADVPEETGENELSGGRALLVEDNELNMEIMRFFLEDIGMSVVCAKNGQEALTFFDESRPGSFDLILMDIMMPVMDGLQATKAIRRLDRPDALTVPIIALSANVMDSDVKKAKMAGMNEHLAKPVDTAQLLETMGKYIKGN